MGLQRPLKVLVQFRGCAVTLLEDLLIVLANLVQLGDTGLQLCLCGMELFLHVV
jgi:hypothetical protein